MHDFIDYLQKKFEIKIAQDEDEFFGVNSFELNDSGDITHLYLYEISLVSIDVLLPIADTLIELELYDVGLNDLLNIKYFTNLETLNISFNPLTDQSLLNVKYLTDLRYLSISATDIENTQELQQALNHLHRLKTLDVSYNSDVKEINLMALTQLETLYAIDTPISNIEKISVNQSLRKLNIRACKMNSMSGLERFPNLISLNLCGSPILKIEGLEQAKKLEQLNLASSYIQKTEGLESLSNLKQLDLRDQELNKIEGLSQLESLEELNLSENTITHVSNLDGLVNLNYLLLDDNRITEFNTDFLFNLKNECLISLTYNPLKELDIVIPSHVTMKFGEPDYVPRGLF